MSTMTRVVICATVAAAVLLTGAGSANALAFNARASALERSWQADQSAGITAGELAEARAALRQVRNRHLGPLPYAIISGAILFDPFTSAEAREVAGARRHAEES